MSHRITSNTGYFFRRPGFFSSAGVLKFFKIAVPALVVAYIFVAFYNITVHERQWDFRTYFYASAFDSQAGNPYDFDKLAEFSNGFVTEPYVYPPLSLFLWKPFLILEYQVSYYLYFILKILAVAFLIILWKRYFIANPAYQILMLVFCLFAFKEAMQVDLYSGNISVFEQLAIWSGIVFFIRKKPWQFSFLIMVASLVKFANIALLLLLLLDNDRKSRAAMLSAATGLVIIHATSFLTYPGLAKGFIGSLFSLGEYGNTNQASYVLLKHLAAWLSNLSLVRIPYLNMVLYLLYLAVILAAVYFTAKGFGFKADRMNFVMGSLLLYVLVVPRFKDYSFILLIVPSLYVIEKAVNNNIVKILITAFILITFFSYQGFLTVLVLFGLYLKHILALKDIIPTPIREPSLYRRG